MRCQYCFDTITDAKKRCPHCGSYQPASRQGSEGIFAGDAGTVSSAVRPGLILPVLVVFVVFVCLLVALVALISPGLLPDSIASALNRATEVPTATPQLTRAAIVTPTSTAWSDHINERAGFSVRLPPGWLVIEQNRTGWRDRVRDLTESYDWIESVFETGQALSVLGSRATDPNLIDLQAPRIFILTAGPARANEAIRDFETIGQTAREDPSQLSEMVTVFTGSDFASRRVENTTVNGREALLVEFTFDSDIFGNVVKSVVRLYFVPVGERIYAIGYFADELSERENRQIYDEIVQSFELLP